MPSLAWIPTLIGEGAREVVHSALPTTLPVADVEQITTGDWVLFIVLVAYCLCLLIGLWRSGQLRPDVFESVPRRDASLNPADVLGFLMPALAMIGFGAAGRYGLMADSRAMGITQMLSLGLLAFVLFRLVLASAGRLEAIGMTCGDYRRGGLWTLIGVMGVIPMTIAGLYGTKLLLVMLGMKIPVAAHDQLRELIADPTTERITVLVVNAVIMAPLIEELMYRGYFQTALWRSGVAQGRWSAILLTSVIFALAHIGVADIYGLGGLFILSVGIGYVVERTGWVLPAVAIHALFNISQIGLALLFAGSK